MATPPTYVAYLELAHNSTTSPRNSASITWAAGDLFVIFVEAADNGTGLPVPSVPTATGLTFSSLGKFGGSNQVVVEAFTATAAAGGTQVIAMAVTGGTFMWGAQIHRLSGSDGVGNVGGVADGSGTKTVSLICGSNNSAVVESVSDWNATAPGTVTWTPAGATTQLTANVNPDYVVYGASWGDQGAAATTTYGLSAGGSGAGPWTRYAVEVKGAAAVASPGTSSFWVQPPLSFPYPAFYMPAPLWTPAVVGMQTEITTGEADLALGAESTAKKVAKITATSGASALGIGSQATAKKVNVAAARAPLGVGSQATARKLAPATGNGATGLASIAAARKAAPAIGRGPLGLGALSTAAKRSTPTVSGQLGLIDVDTAAKKRSTPLVTAVLGVVDIDTAAKKINVASGVASVGFAEWAVHVDTRAVTARSILGLVGLATAKKSAPAVANAPQGLAGLSTARKAARPALSVPAGLLGLATAQKRATPAGTAPLGLIDVDLAAKKRATPTATGALGFVAWANRAARAITALAALGLIDIDLAAKKRATPLATAALGLVDIDTAVKKRATGDTASASLGVLPVAAAGKRQGISGRAIFGLDSWIVFVPPITYGTGNAGQTVAGDAMAGSAGLGGTVGHGAASTGRTALATVGGEAGTTTASTGRTGRG